MEYRIFNLLDCNRNLIESSRFKSFEWAVITLEDVEDGIYYIENGINEIKVEIKKSPVIKRRIKSYKWRNYTIAILGDDTCSISNHISKTTFKFKNQENFEEKFMEHKMMLDGIERIGLTFEQQMSIETALTALRDVGDNAEEDYKEEIKELENLLKV